ncbi:MAG: hypothetical protein CMO80_19950 [Verrucomicrobiales bacterium]|nr:hypothetical protein [Verrucomicrobiales bacterium]
MGHYSGNLLQIEYVKHNPSRSVIFSATTLSTMKQLTLILTLLALAISPVAIADDTKKPTDEEKIATEAKPAEEAKEEGAKEAEAETGLVTEAPPYLEQLKKLLDEWTNKTKELGAQGKQVSDETASWLKNDFRKIGDWNYKQVSVPFSKISELEEILNEHGTERWECFFVQPYGQKIHLLFKRPAVSYLHKLSQVDFLRLLSSGGEEAASAAE